ncbi:uncharacterized protein M421DRAFT_3069 [Didymella exigua CBS 183.55]|uniref:HMG box domain-containing protein n=1 Tax=Didymella exigua CBS 183.55 TaxID=1150837 RepID=A0A6A5RWW4_9PLEO|nr:uncharacterized protein M421DRAFT_3069 [Didymella exigua CBS 183.55]KAF1930776.1 hypothetical protein M421DRAFT_3069 [Didymella exigua CBS 183.55]
MLARGALCRLAAGVPKQAAHDLPKLATLVQAARSGLSLPVRSLAHVIQLQTRSYATTKAQKDPAAPVKKAVKAKAAAGKKVTKTAVAKKAPGSQAKTTKKKAAPKKPVKKLVKKPVKKPAKKPKKVLTDEEKLKAVVRELKKVALKEPVARNRISTFNVYIAEQVKGSAGKAALSQSAASFKDISPAEREKYNHLTSERNEARLAEYNAWVKSHTPEQIRLANNARNLLRKKLAGKYKRQVAHTQPIEDDRMPKRPSSAWAFFFAERQASSDFHGIAVPERARLISAEWKALSAGEKQRFEDQGAAERQRYARETAVLAKAA